MYRIAFTDRQSSLKVDKPALRRIVKHVLSEEQIADADISIALVDDPEMHELNRRHLDHDYPTDVLSFLLDSQFDDEGHPSIEAEIVVSTQTAVRESTRFGWPADAELMLYVVHGLLHVCGYDDMTPREKARMRRRERAILATVDLVPPRVARS